MLVFCGVNVIVAAIFNSNKILSFKTFIPTTNGQFAADLCTFTLTILFGMVDR